MNGATGLSALIRLGASLENDFELETVSIGKSADESESYMMEIAGQHLAYRISLRNDGGLLLSAQVMDTADPPDLLLRDCDSAKGWRTVRFVVAALETHEIKSLARPIEAGTGEFGLVII
jgi:hypothetical protein